LFAALVIRNGYSDLVASERIFDHNDYGDYYPIIYRNLIKRLLTCIFGLILVKANKESKLSESEKLGLMSSLYSITNDSGANAEKYPIEYEWAYKNSLGAKEVAEYILYKNYLKIYVFNGRTASSYNISRLQINNKIKIHYYEYANGIWGYKLYPNPPHASYINGKLLTDFRNNIVLSYNEITELGKLFRLNKINNIYSKNYLFKSNKEYDVVIFLGSDHEYTAVDMQICGLEWFGNVDFCRRVINKYGNKKKYAIRCHPNSRADLNWKIQFNKLEDTLKSLAINYDLFGPESSVDSYSLLGERTIAAIEFSSISIDAVLLGKKVDIFANIDTKYILETYANSQTFKNVKEYISEIFALNDLFLTRKFNKLLIPLIYFLYKFEILIFHWKKNDFK